MIRKLATAAALGAAIVAVPGVASATPGDPGQCTGNGVCVDDPTGSGYLGPYAYGDGSATRNSGEFGFWDRVRGLEKELLNLW